MSVTSTSISTSAGTAVTTSPLMTNSEMLIQACDDENEKRVQELLKNIEIPENGFTALHHIARSGNTRLLSLFLKIPFEKLIALLETREGDEQMTPLMIALDSGHEEFALQLM